ncbi:MAG: DUF935 family protein [Chthonomonadales bacterium]
MPMIERAPVLEPPLEERFREEMTAWDSILKSVFRLPPYNPDDLIQKQGIDVYDRMMQDPQVRASINTKRYALLARPWQVLPADAPPERRADAEEARRFVDSALRSLRGPNGSLRDLRVSLFEMMSAFYRGFSLAELIWRIESDGEWRGKAVPDMLKFKNPKQIGFEVDDFLNVEAITSWTPGRGLIRVPRQKVLLFIHNQRDDLPYGESDLRAVYLNYWSKQSIIKFWNLRLQKFGIPFAFANMSNGQDVAAQAIAKILREMQQESSAVFPMNVKPELLQTASDGGDAFLGALEWHNQQIALGVLLQTLTSGEPKRSGSLALGKVHFDILLYALECMKQDVEAAINSQLVRPMIDFNFGHGLYPKFTLGNVDEKDIGQLASVVDVLLKHGVADAKEPTIREMFNLPPMPEGSL